MNTISSFTVASAIADERIDMILERRLKNVHEDQPDTAQEIGFVWGRFWLRARRQAT